MDNEPKMHDSGKRQQFEGGAVRDTADGKPQYNLISPFVWEFIQDEPEDKDDQNNTELILKTLGIDTSNYLLYRDIEHIKRAFKFMAEIYGTDRLCRWLELGAQKYSRFNWTKGMPITRCLDSLGRHISKIKKTNEDHIAAIMCNLMFIIHYHECMKLKISPDTWYDLWDFNKNQPAEI